MNFIAHGRVSVGDYKGMGQLVFTRESIFVLRSDSSAPSAGLLFGLVGVFVATLIDRRKGQRNPPDFLSDPELAALDVRTKKQLLKSQLLVKLSTNANFRAKATRLGFDFENAANRPVSYAGLAYKRKIRKCLDAMGVPCDA